MQNNLNPISFSTGLVVNHRRFGPDLSLDVSTSGTWTRATGEREGEGVNVSLSRPLYNLDQRWSFGVSGGARRARARITQGGEVVTDDDPATAEIELTPIEWEVRSWSAGLAATRQWQGAYQRSLSLGISAGQSERGVLDGVSASQEARWREEFFAPDRFQFGPSLSFSWYRRTFTALTDISTYGLREDLLLGPSFTTAHTAVIAGDRAYLPSFSLGYGWSVMTRGFVRIGFASSARVEGVERTQIVNRELSGGIKWALPIRPWGDHIGFFVGRLSWLSRWNNISNALSVIGGSTGLRGYPDGAFTLPGGDVSRNNLEYRSPPIKWSFIHLGLVAFYDAASIHENIQSFRLKQSVGGGIRFLFPQLNRSVFRLDLAAPLSDYPAGQSRPGIVFSFGSAQGFFLMPWEG